MLFWPHLRAENSKSPTRRKRPDSKLCHQTTFVILEGRKRIKLFSFFKYDVLSAGVVESIKWDFLTNYGRVLPTGEEKTPERNEENIVLK